MIEYDDDIYILNDTISNELKDWPWLMAFNKEKDVYLNLDSSVGNNLYQLFIFSD